MTVAYDAFSASTSGTGDRTWTHTPVGTPGSVIVMGVDRGTTDQSTGATYGGVSMTEVALSPHLMTIGEGFALYCYVLTSGVPAGPQTVILLGSGTPARVGYSITFTGGDIEVIDTDASIESASQADPTCVLALGGRTCFCAIVLASGHSATTSIAPLSSWTARNEIVQAAADLAACYTYDTIGTADVTAGWTQTAQDAVAIAIAVSEVAGAASTTFQTLPIRTASNSTPVNTQTSSTIMVTYPAEFNAAEFNPGEFNTVGVIAGEINGPPFGLTLDIKSVGVSKGQISQSAAQGSKSFSIAKNSEGS